MQTASIKAQHATPIMLRPDRPCLVSEYTCTRLLSLRVFMLSFLLMGAVLPQSFPKMPGSFLLVLLISTQMSLPQRAFC